MKKQLLYLITALGFGLPAIAMFKARQPYGLSPQEARSKKLEQVYAFGRPEFMETESTTPTLGLTQEQLERLAASPEVLVNQMLAVNADLDGLKRSYAATPTPEIASRMAVAQAQLDSLRTLFEAVHAIYSARHQ